MLSVPVGVLNHGLRPAGRAPDALALPAPARRIISNSTPASAVRPPLVDVGQLPIRHATVKADGRSSGPSLTRSRIPLRQDSGERVSLTKRQPEGAAVNAFGACGVAGGDEGDILLEMRVIVYYTNPVI